MWFDTNESYLLSSYYQTTRYDVVQKFENKQLAYCGFIDQFLSDYLIGSEVGLRLALLNLNLST